MEKICIVQNQYEASQHLLATSTTTCSDQFQTFWMMLFSAVVFVAVAGYFKNKV